MVSNWLPRRLVSFGARVAHVPFLLLVAPSLPHQKDKFTSPVRPFPPLDIHTAPLRSAIASSVTRPYTPGVASRAVRCIEIYSCTAIVLYARGRVYTIHNFYFILRREPRVFTILTPSLIPACARDFHFCHHVIIVSKPLQSAFVLLLDVEPLLSRLWTADVTGLTRVRLVVG